MDDIFSLAQLVDACEEQIKDNKLGDLWLVNERGQILLHPHSCSLGNTSGIW